MSSLQRPATAFPTLPPADLDELLRAALREDLGAGDRTSEVCVPAEARARGELVAKAQGVVAALDAFARVFTLLDAAVVVELLAREGARVGPGEVVARLAGPARALLAGERTALNVVQRASGVATLTARFVTAARGRVRVLDTRKTTPLWRRLEKRAVVAGGGENHRFGLDDEAMIKDNHRDLSVRPLEELVQELRRRHGAAFRVTVEARDEEEALEAAAAGADVVLLDNLSPERMRALVPQIRQAAAGAVEIEASGGVALWTLDAIADAGVDRVSVGALTHSAPALDLSLALFPESAR